MATPTAPPARAATRRHRAPALLLAVLGLLAVTAQAEEPPMNAGMLAHALDRLAGTARVLYVAAHPDDENTRLLAYLANARHVTAAYLSMTRGGGGQNLIGTDIHTYLFVHLAQRAVNHALSSIQTPSRKRPLSGMVAQFRRSSGEQKRCIVRPHFVHGQAINLGTQTCINNGDCHGRMTVGTHVQHLVGCEISQLSLD